MNLMINIYNLLPVRFGNPGKLVSYGKMVRPYIFAEPSHRKACILLQSGHSLLGQSSS